AEIVVRTRDRIACGVRRGIVGRDFLRHWIDAVARDDVSGERRALPGAVGEGRQCVGIVEYDSRSIAGEGFGEVPASLRIRGHGRCKVDGKPLAQTFVVAEDEGLILDHWTAAICAKLMPFKRRI